MSSRTAIVYDIETGPDESREGGLDQFAPEFDVPANYKKPESIAAYRQEKLEEWRGRHALSAITGRVLAIGIREEGRSSILCEDDEALMLAAFWARIAPRDAITRDVVGFNSNGFDLPFLVRRSWLNRVPVPRTLFDGRYLNRRCIDIMQLWKVGDYQATVKLDTLARWLGLPGKSGNGADFASLLKTDRAAALAYLERDLEITEKCAIALGVIDPEEWHDHSEEVAEIGSDY